jgi:acetyl-CoA synthetase
MILLAYKQEIYFWCSNVSYLRVYKLACLKDLGPFAVGDTQVIFEGVPTYPDASRYWQIIQKNKVSIFYTAPTVIRTLIRLGSDLPKQYDLSSLRLLGSVGEPISPKAWQWYY